MLTDNEILKIAQEEFANMGAQTNGADVDLAKAIMSNQGTAAMVDAWSKLAAVISPCKVIALVMANGILAGIRAGEKREKWNRLEVQ